MWTLETPWYELIIRNFIVFSFLFIVARLWGKKHLGKMTAFDLILLLIISESVQNALVADDKSVSGSMIAVMTLVLMNVSLNRLTFRFPRLEKVINGDPEVLIRQGDVDKQILDKEKITDQELHEALRQNGVLSANEVKLAMIETNGKISVIKKEQ